MQLLTATLIRIVPLNHKWLKLAQSKLDNKTKPKGALGRLEEFACHCAAIACTVEPKLGPKVIYTFAADHGVTEERVSACPREVTAQMVLNLLAGGAGVNVLARHIGATVKVVDIGVDHDFGKMPGLIAKKVARGTRNLAKGPAMTREEAISALEVGIELANRAKAEGVAMLGTGEMGIGNTTPSSAIIALYSGGRVAEVTHRGTGIDDAALRHKIRIVEQGLALNNPKSDDPIDVLAKVGGLEIAGIAGLILGAAANRIPVVVDGFISTAGALIATELNPLVREYMFAAHRSAEVGHRFMLERIGLEPILDLQFRLGEGTGAALAMGLVEAGIRVLNEMATFSQAGVSDGTDRVGVPLDAV